MFEVWCCSLVFLALSREEGLDTADWLGLVTTPLYLLVHSLFAMRWNSTECFGFDPVPSGISDCLL